MAPQALAAGLKRFAIVLPTSALATMNLKDQLEQIPSAKLDIGYFESVDKARAWIIR